MITLFTSHKPSLNECPTGLKNNLDGWRSKNPSFNFKYYNDLEMQEWMQKNTSDKTFRYWWVLNTGAGRADLFRICHMNVDGGVWIDADLPSFDIKKEKSNFEDLLQVHHTLLIKNKSYSNPRYTMMASNPRGKLLTLLEEKIVKLTEECYLNKKSDPTISITGPFVLHSLLCEILNLSNILDLKIGTEHKDIPFIYIDDIVPSKTDRYREYNTDLKEMKVQHHHNIKATI